MFGSFMEPFNLLHFGGNLDLDPVLFCKEFYHCGTGNSKGSSSSWFRQQSENT